MAEEAKGQAAVYVAWSTFNNTLNDLVQGIPNVIDRSAFPGQSWGVQAQLIAGFKFLGLITDAGKPTQSLEALAVRDQAARKEKLKTILKERYAELFALDLTKTTPVQLNERMAASYNVTGDTREKAMRFFLSAVQHAGIPVSRLLQPKGGNGTGAAPTPRRRRTVPRPRPEAQNPPLAPSGIGGSTSRVVMLRSGGTLTVSAAADLLNLSGDDREFVFGLIDKLADYEKKAEAE